MRRIIVTLLAGVALVQVPTAPATFVHPSKPVTMMSPGERVRYFSRSWAHYAYVAAHGAPARRRHENARAARWALRELERARAALRPPHEAAWECIHRYEGSWTDPDPPYYGGLQMDLTFQRDYGSGLLARKGTADHWTPLEQMWVAERAYRSGRGFYPWPNTARYCGLL